MNRYDKATTRQKEFRHLYKTLTLQQIGRMQKPPLSRERVRQIISHKYQKRNKRREVMTRRK